MSKLKIYINVNLILKLTSAYTVHAIFSMIFIATNLSLKYKDVNFFINYKLSFCPISSESSVNRPSWPSRLKLFQYGEQTDHYLQ